MSIYIVWHKDALDSLRRLEIGVSRRIMKKMKDIRLNPERYVLSLVNMNVSKIRIGNYRIFANYYPDRKTHTIHSIKHRKNSYKK